MKNLPFCFVLQEVSIFLSIRQYPVHFDQDLSFSSSNLSLSPCTTHDRICKIFEVSFKAPEILLNTDIFEIIGPSEGPQHRKIQKN